MKKLNRCGKITGKIPLLYDGKVIGDLVKILNAHSDVINSMASVIENQQREIDRLKRK